MKNARGAIALLITLMFVMIISVAIGYSLKQVNKASAIVAKESLLYQSSAILSDILDLLKRSNELQQLTQNSSPEDFNLFIQNYSYLPLDIASQKVILSVQSARARININSLNSLNEPYFQEYFNKKMVSSAYTDLIKEFLSENEAQNRYNNAIFDENPYLFNKYIASPEHLRQINDFYIREYNDENIKSVDFKKLFYFSQDSNMSIDLNYANADVWELILATDQPRAEALANSELVYNSINDLDLSQEEQQNLSKFKTSFFEPFLLVTIEIIQEDNSAKISFEYDINSQKGKNFVLEI
jgi:hypothetical protein